MVVLAVWGLVVAWGMVGAWQVEVAVMGAWG